MGAKNFRLYSYTKKKNGFLYGVMLYDVEILRCMLFICFCPHRIELAIIQSHKDTTQKFKIMF